MNVQKTEATLAKYHLLHFVIGLIFAAVLLAIPKVIGVAICALLLAVVLPPATLPAEFDNKWFGTAALILGAIAAWLVMHLLHLA